MLKNSVLAGEDEYDLVVEHMIESANLAINNYLKDLTEVTYIDPSQPWWNQSAYENLSIDGHSWLITGDIAELLLERTFVLYFNKNLAENYNIDADALYKETLDGKWTFDRLTELTKDVWTDLNGNNEKDTNDLFGIKIGSTSSATPFIYSFGEKTVSINSDGIPELSMNEDKFSSIVEKVYKFYYEQVGTATDTIYSDMGNMFKEGRALFSDGVLGHTLSFLNSMEDDYGILPYPKWDEEQDSYYTMSDGSAPLVSIPKTVEDIEFVGIITEALAAESYNSVTPVLYDIALKVRGTRDEQSVEVIDLAVRNSVVDFGYVFGDYRMMGFTLSNLMGQKNSNFASYYASNKNTWESRIESVVSAALSE